jgi:hypothetical protein
MNSYQAMYKDGSILSRIRNVFSTARERLPFRELFLIIIWGIGTWIAFWIMRQFLTWPIVAFGSRLGGGMPVSSGLPSLQFRDDGTFHLSIFNDLHFGEDNREHPPTKLFGSSLTFQQHPSWVGDPSRTKRP